MNIDKMCADPDTRPADIKKAEACVKKLQRRIVEAYSHRCYDKVDYLQHLLIHSYSAKMLAISVVAHSKGRYTAGVDDKVFESVQDIVFNSSQRTFKPSPLRRIYVPKGNGKMRPISIPTVNDRIMHTIYKFALEPIAELTADDCSFGFRPNRSCRGAILKCVDIMAHNPKMEWVIKIDIKACFDNISHKWLLDNIPLDKDILRKFLKCGYVEGYKFYETEYGVPQGSPLSAIIANMTLDGLESVLNSNFRKKVQLIRYADDIVIFGDNTPLLVQSVKSLVEKFLSERGLELSPEKTNLQNIDSGFSFLGFRVYKANNRIYTVPTDKNIISLLEKIGKILKGDFTISYKITCEKLNALIRGWFNYYVNVTTKQSLYGVEYEVCSYIHRSTDDKRIVEFVQSLFEDFDKKYIN